MNPNNIQACDLACYAATRKECQGDFAGAIAGFYPPAIDFAATKDAQPFLKRGDARTKERGLRR